MVNARYAGTHHRNYRGVAAFCHMDQRVFSSTVVGHEHALVCVASQRFLSTSALVGARLTIPCPCAFKPHLHLGPRLHSDSMEY